MPWWVWAIGAAAVALAELHAPGCYLIWIALGAALIAAVQAVWDLGLEGQLIGFVIASSLSCFGGYHVYRRLRRDSNHVDVLNQRDQAMLGARGTISTAIVNGQGKVRVGDTVWLAEGTDLPEGTQVTVAAVRGARLIVKRDGA